MAEEKKEVIKYETEGKVIKCKAAIAWKEKSKLEICDIEVAVPKADEVRIKLLCTGVCHTDWYVFNYFIKLILICMNFFYLKKGIHCPVKIQKVYFHQF